MWQRPYICRFTLTVAMYLSIAALAVGTTAARADEIDSLYQKILQRPKDTALNLRFAQLAEQSNHLRWALAAYERVVLNDPDNAEGRQGLQRVRRALQPETTLLTLQAGTQYETNPLYYLPPRRSEWQALGSAALLVERNFNGTRWRTNSFAAGILHAHETELNYGVVGLDTGPVLDVWSGWAFHPAIGGRAAAFDHRFYYSEGAASATFDTNSGGIYRSLQVRGAYRSYDDFFPSTEGFYVEARGKVAVPNALGSGTVMIASPWVVWSDISGVASVITPTITDLQPGAYVEYGGRLDLIRSLTQWLIFGLNAAVSERDYRNDIAINTGEKRRDTILNTGASLIFANLFAYQTDLRFDYKYLLDHSTDVTKSFNDHIITASVVARFDPTLGPPVPNARP